MSKIFFLVFTVVLAISCRTNVGDGEKISNQAFVQDNASIFSDDETRKLTLKILNYEVKSTNEICIFTLDSIPNHEKPMYYATNLANNLGVGKKEKDNGLLILVSKYDRELAIVTGLETENYLTDYKCKVLIDSIIVPKFKKGEFYLGINNALDRIIYEWK